MLAVGRTACALMLALFLLSGTGHAAALEDALAALGRKDFVRAAALLAPLAEQGDARAQAELGLLYELGAGVETNIEKSVAFYRKSADQGFALGQTRLGVLYEQGRGVALNGEEAVRLYKLAAAQGLVEAEGNLCRVFVGNDAVKPDPREGMPWCFKAADHGDPRAQFQVGYAYYRGNGVPGSAEMAYLLIDKAAAQGYPPAIYNKAYMLVAGDGVAQDMDQGMELMESAAKLGVPSAFITLASGYELGKGRPANPARAMFWYREALLEFYPQALIGIGRLAAEGYSDPAIPAKELAYVALTLAIEVSPADKDKAEAMDHLKTVKLKPAELNAAKSRLKEAKTGGTEAYVHKVLNTCRIVDILAAPDEAKAIEDCRRLAALGIPLGEYNLAWIKMHGVGIKPDAKGGLALLIRAAEDDFAVAELELGKEYANGNSVRQDLRQALAWLLVAEQRIPDARLTTNYLDDARDYISTVRQRLPAADVAWAEAWCNDFVAKHPSPF